MGATEEKACTFDVCVLAESAAPQTLPGGGVEAVPHNPGDKVRILLVDNDPHMRRQLKEYSRPAGFRLNAVETESEALAAAEASPPAVVIVREHLAGDALLRRVRSSPGAPQVLLITEAGESRPGSIQGVPVDGCIAIPFTQEQFISTLELALRHREQPQNTSAEPSANAISILIAEADPAIRKLLCAILEAEGYTATEAADDEEARQLILTMRFDVVIVDVLSRTPGRPPLAAQLLSMEPAPCVLFLSPSAANSGAMRGTLGNLAFLPKPFAVSTLLEAIGSLVRHKRRG